MKPYYQDDYVTIYHADCRDILPQLDVKVDLVLTDPPYPLEYDFVWDIPADDVPPVMSDGSNLLTLCGHYQIPRVMDALRRNLTYKWMCIIPNKHQPLMHGWNIKVCWKPVLWFVKGKPSSNEIMCDNLSLVGRGLWDFGRQNHKWGQSEEMAINPIMKLPNSLILDPFLGSGTTAYCAKKLNRKCIGIEIEEKYCEIAAKRCSQQVFDLRV